MDGESPEAQLAGQSKQFTDENMKCTLTKGLWQCYLPDQQTGEAEEQLTCSFTIPEESANESDLYWKYCDGEQCYKADTKWDRAEGGARLSGSELRRFAAKRGSRRLQTSCCQGKHLEHEGCSFWSIYINIGTATF